ncbi:MAG TPA: Rieske 2Fe-2S domain-containing protein, partial [Chloroflexota bacterium]
MLTEAENELLTRVGPGTPCGELMRRYWHPIAAVAQIPERGTRPVRLLGEDLVLFRDRSGNLGLIGDHCPHRRASLVYGIPEAEGLRCAYHGWLWAADGKCLEQPYETTEDPTSTFKDRVTVTSYPVQELGGMIFAYLGPEPAPLIPRWDLFVTEDVPKEVGFSLVPCNWLQITENSLDPVHLEWAHGNWSSYVRERLGQKPGRPAAPHTKLGFDLFDHGIIKRRVREGADESHAMWAVGHPVVFPYTLKSGSTRDPVFQIRVPMDDTHTLYWYYHLYHDRPELGVRPPEEWPVYEIPMPHLTASGEPEWSLIDNNSGQDNAMWNSQGAISDRWNENLGLSDKGVNLYRKLLEVNIAKVREGLDPMNTFRDPA